MYGPIHPDTKIDMSNYNVFNTNVEHSGTQERARLRKEICNVDAYDVVLTTYEMVQVPDFKQTFSSRVVWRVVALDEGECIRLFAWSRFDSHLALSFDDFYATCAQ